MLFKDLSIFLERLEKTPSRNSMIEILAELYTKASVLEIDKIAYLLQGRVAPLYVSLEFGMADKMLIRAIAKAYKEDDDKVKKYAGKIGDLGQTSEFLAKENGVKGRDISIDEVFNILKKTAQTNGGGSVEAKVELISELLRSLDPLSARFVARIPVAKLRLGFSDMTVLDSLSWMIDKSKKYRVEIEKAYNVRPDLGFISKTVKGKGIKGLKDIAPQVFTPILMARAERMSSGEEIIKKIGECAIEPKIDGFRLQAHYDGKDVKLYTRNLEDSTFMYPDLVEAIKKQIKVKNVIFEGEAIAYNPQTDEFLPFQETVQRKRKYGITEKALKVPLKLICFDLLYMNGKSLIHSSYTQRRKELEGIVKKDEALILSFEKIVHNAKEIEIEFDDAVSRGLEGIMAKRLDGVYQAGARGWNWIKYKRSYSGELHDTIDAVVMGYYQGKGKRTSFGLGAFLIGIYDKKRDMITTVAKIGTGLTDMEWKTLYQRCVKLRSEKKPALYDVDKMLNPDEWVKPEIIVEIKADEITRSPIHTAGRVLKPSKSGEAFDVQIPGFALRFPRLERFRDDKKIEEATNLSEFQKMFEAQKKQNVRKTS